MANIDNAPQDTMNCCQSKFAAFQPPCCHNSWDNVRVKGNTTTLICRICLTRWKLPHPVAIMCPEFFETRGKCPLGVSCPYLHVYRSKRQDICPTEPEYIVGERDQRLYSAAITVLGSHEEVIAPSSVFDEILTTAGMSVPSRRNSAVSSNAGAPKSPTFTHSPYRAAQSFTKLNDCTMCPAPEVSLGSDSDDLSTSSTSGSECQHELRGLLPITKQFVPSQRQLLTERHFIEHHHN